MAKLNDLKDMINEIYFEDFVDSDGYEELDKVGFNSIKNNVLYVIGMENKKTLEDYSNEDLYDIVYDIMDRQLEQE